MLYSLLVSLSLGEDKEFPINTIITIGRDTSAPRAWATDKKLYLPRTFVSKNHCVLIPVPPDETNESPYYKIKDGGLSGSSTNGTWINGRRIERAVILKHKDVITFAGNCEYPRVVFIDNYATNEATPDEDTQQHEYSQAIIE